MEGTLTQLNQSEETRAVWSTANVNDLPDSSFAYIEPGGEKDEDGKTTPRNLRHLPYKDADGKVDAAHVRNALARLSQTQIPDEGKSSAKSKLVSAAKSVGIEVGDEEDGKSEERAEESEIHALWMPAFPVTRRDADEWIVEGQATAEVPDTFGTIFTYEASKRAFSNWINRYANVREMHGKKAAGKGLEVRFDDANKRVLVRTRVSKAEPGVWTKFHEGVLNGFSIGADRDYEMGRMTYQGKSYPAITRYNLAELSYVDAPSCPGSDACIVARADGSLSEIIDDSEPEQPIQATQEPELERAGARLSADSRDALHKMRDQAMQLCGCDECQAMCAHDEPDGDEAMTERMQSMMQGALERSLAPVYQRQQAFLARIAQYDTNYEAIQHSLDEIKKLQERFNQIDEIKTTLERMASASTLDEVRADLAHVKGQVNAIADTPRPGGPVLNGARNPYDKTSAYSPQQQAPANRSQIEQETIQRLAEGGAFRTMDDQVAAAALLMRPVPMR